MIKKIYFIALLSVASQAMAQTSKEEIFETPEKTGGVYYAYPAADIKTSTPIPEGYKPFYISHLGRHGSRFLIDDKDYKDVIDLFQDAAKAGKLTPLGQDVLNRLNEVWKETEFRGGDLSPLGVREQRGIAERMFGAYSEVFTPESKITACATTVVRCVLSMDAFCERLKEFQPALSITRDSGEKWQRFLNHHTPTAIAYRSAKDTWRPGFERFQKAHVNPDRLLKSLFTDSKYITSKTSAEDIMWGLFGIAGGMQNIETEGTFYDIFEKQELFDLWQVTNHKLYVNDAGAAQNGGVMMENAKPLLRSILDSAQNIIDAKGKGADFRFAHDGNIIPLTMLLHIEGSYNSISDPKEFYTAWSDFKVAPMAGNIQIVFFRSENSDDILVKFMQNENEVRVPPIKSDQFPYYRWEDVSAYYANLLGR